MTYIYKGPDHPYYTHNRKYNLTIERGLFGRVRIYVARGYENRVTVGSYVKYRNFEAFKADWRRT